MGNTLSLNGDDEEAKISLPYTISKLKGCEASLLHIDTSKPSRIMTSREVTSTNDIFTPDSSTKAQPLSAQISSPSRHENVETVGMPHRPHSRNIHGNIPIPPTQTQQSPTSASGSFPYLEKIMSAYQSHSLGRSYRNEGQRALNSDRSVTSLGSNNQQELINERIAQKSSFLDLSTFSLASDEAYNTSKPVYRAAQIIPPLHNHTSIDKAAKYSLNYPDADIELGEKLDCGISPGVYRSPAFNKANQRHSKFDIEDPSFFDFVASKEVRITIDLDVGMPLHNKPQRTFTSSKQWGSRRTSLDSHDLGSNLSLQKGSLPIRRLINKSLEVRPLSDGRSEISSDTSIPSIITNQESPIEILLIRGKEVDTPANYKSSRSSKKLLAPQIETFVHSTSLLGAKRNIEGSTLTIMRSPMLYPARPRKLGLSKFNSCSTLFVDYTLILADLADTLKCAAKSLTMSILQNLKGDYSRTEDIFSDSLHPLSSHIQFHKALPSEDDVFKFLECLFNAAELNVECAIISLIYIERMLQKTKVSLQTCNWARIILGGVLLSAKVWDDHAVWNIDFCQIFPDVEVTDMNELERFYLEAIEFDVSIKVSNYTKAYFELRNMSKIESRRPNKPLTLSDVRKLESRLSAQLDPKYIQIDQPLSQEAELRMMENGVDLYAKLIYSGSTLQEAVNAATATGRSSALHGQHICAKDAAAAISFDKAMKRSRSDYIFVSSKPPAQIRM